MPENGTPSAGRLRGVLNRYMTGWVIFGQPDTDWAGLATVLDECPEGAKRLQDNPGGTDSLLPYLRKYEADQVSVEELMNLTATDFIECQPPAGVIVRRGEMADLAPLTDFYAHAGHMKRTPAAVEQPLRRTRLWLAERDGVIVSAALTNAEIADRAMIGGVYTPPEKRGQGLSKAVCSALCADLLTDDKCPVLYWDTPAAGAVYRKLGFRPVGHWRAIRLRAKG